MCSGIECHEGQVPDALTVMHWIVQAPSPKQNGLCPYHRELTYQIESGRFATDPYFARFYEIPIAL